MKKLLFVSPDYGYPPLSAAAVATTLQKANISYDILDLCMQDGLEERVLSGEYWGVATTGLIVDYNVVAGILQTVKSLSPGMVTILGGRIAFTPPYLLARMPVDFVVLGDAEGTMPELVQAIAAGEKDFSKVKSICYRGDDNSLVPTAKRKSPSLDSFTLTWDDLDLQTYITSPPILSNWPGSYPILNGMGCFGSCTFCAPGIKGVRLRPVEAVLREMQESVEKYDFHYFAFLSELFYWKADDVVAFCEGYKKTKIGLPWACSTRLDFDPELFPVMVDAGLKRVGGGIEGYDDDALKKMGKNITEAQIKQYTSKARELGLEVSVGTMAGNLGDTRKSMQKTLDFVKENKLIAPCAQPLLIYPGTKVYSIALEKGLIKDEFEYCDMVYKRDSEALFYGPDYPNVTTLSKEELTDAYQEFKYGLMSYMTVTFLAGYNEKTEVSTCRVCGARIKTNAGHFFGYNCSHCISFNQVNIYYNLLNSPKMKPRIAEMLRSAKRIGIMGDFKFMETMYICAKGFEVPDEKLCFIGDNVRMRTAVPIVAPDAVEGVDTVFLTGLFQPDKMKRALAGRGIPKDRILNIFPIEYKNTLKRGLENDEDPFDYTCDEDVEFLGEAIGKKMLSLHGTDSKWAILPAGEFGLRICKGFLNVGANVVALGDSYKTDADLDLDIPVRVPNELGDAGIEKTIICTPSLNVQRELCETLVGSGKMERDNVFLLHEMYRLLWDNLLT